MWLLSLYISFGYMNLLLFLFICFFIIFGDENERNEIIMYSVYP